MEIVDYVKHVNSQAKKGGNWPACLEYNVEDDHVIIKMTKGFSKTEFRRLDSWGLAFLNQTENECKIKIKKILFNIPRNTEKINTLKYDLESFKRRVSYLNINNEDLEFNVIYGNKYECLYTENQLFKRPDDEIAHEKLEDRKDKDKPGRLEKDFQKFLFGKDSGKEYDDRTNERLAIIGFDFFNLKKKELKMYREFPTGVFKGKISETTRILPTEFIDIVTFNKWKQLSIIEIKLNDSQLEMISQILDYSLFFSCYIDKLLPIIKEKLGRKPHDKAKKIICCYVVNNHFHKKFDDIWKYYITKNRSYNFELKKVVLGYTEEY